MAPLATLSMRLLPRACVAKKCAARSLARLDWRCCSAAGWAETRTPLRHRRDTSRIPAAGRAPTSRASFPKPDETASPPRAHPPASARGQTIRALPWEDANARLLRLGIKVAPRPARPGEIFPSPARARRAWTRSNDHGFFCYPVEIWRIRKKPALRPTDPLSFGVSVGLRFTGELSGYHTWLSPRTSRKHPRDSGSRRFRASRNFSKQKWDVAEYFL